jgi:hypothetical protein
MKYTITIGGRGSEVITHKLTEEQHNTFKEGRVEEDQMEHDEIDDILGLEALFEDTEPRYMGAYLDSLYLQVKDENDEVVFTQEVIDYDKIISDEVYCDGNHYLFIEDYSKGDFWVYNIELEEEFDKDKLVLELTDIGCRIDLVTGISYDGNKFEDVRDYGDTSSKGFYYILSED